MLQSKTFDLTFKDASGKELIIEDAPYGSYITPEIIKSNKPYGFITQYFEGDKLYVLSDWKSGDSSLGLTFKVSGTTDFTAGYTEAKIYSAAALNDEAITVGVTSAQATERDSIRTSTDTNI